jgi:hypothetical protein
MANAAGSRDGFPKSNEFIGKREPFQSCTQTSRRNSRSPYSAPPIGDRYAIIVRRKRGWKRASIDHRQHPDHAVRGERGLDSPERLLRYATIHRRSISRSFFQDLKGTTP